MDFIKGRIKVIPEKAAQPKVADRLMEDDFICVFRERDLLRNQVHRPPIKRTFGIFKRIKMKIRSLTHDN